MSSAATPVLFIPALLCDEALYSEVIDRLGASIDAQVLISSKPTLQESVDELLTRVPERFVLVGTSYGGNVAMQLALAAPERVSALCLMGCNPEAAEPGGPDLAAALEAVPDVVIGKLAGVVVRSDDTAAVAAFKAMAGRIGGAVGAAQARAVMGRQAVTSQLSALDMPSLVLWGAEDAAVPMAIGQKLADALPRSEF